MLCSNRSRAGTKHHQYNGGLSFDREQQRWRIMCRDGSQTTYARAVVETRLKRHLRPGEIAHHENEDTTDDRDANLVLTTRGEHIKLHLHA